MAEAKKPAAKKPTKAAVVFATQTCHVAWKGGRSMLYKGQAYKSDDPLVKARPDLFTSDPEIVQPHVRHAAVERATAAPGEKRG